MMQIFGGSWRISRRCIAINEGGFVCGLFVSTSGFVDVWFKLPVRGARSYRVNRWPSGRWSIGGRL